MRSQGNGAERTHEDMGRKIVRSAVAAAMMCGAAAAEKPLLVGITEICQTKDRARTVSVGSDYAEAVAKGGNMPVVISRFGSDEQIDAILARIDLLLLPGGGDIAPARYGEKAGPTLGDVSLLRDSFEWRVLALAKKRRLPIVGICRGCQVLNVFHGGTLWQDLPSQFPAKDVQHRNVHHAISIVPDSLLAKMVGVTSATVNSTHHQAAKKIAPGFRVVAKSPEGVVEAIEAVDYPAIGVQFHPERMVAQEKDELFLKFFQNLKLLK